MIQVFEDGSAVIQWAFITIVVPAFDSIGDIITVTIG
jgi:hypothetical protein